MNNKINVSDNLKVPTQNNIQQNNIQLPQNIENNKNIIGENLKNSELQKSLLDMNQSLRTDIKLSIAIFKQKNNFQHNYINHNFKNAV